MSVPTYDCFIEPLLRFLASKNEAVRARDAHEGVADSMGLSQEARQERLPSGNALVFKNRNAWAQDRLKRAGLSCSPRRGFWELTEAGIRFVAENPRPLSAEIVRKIAMDFDDVRRLVDAGEFGDGVWGQSSEDKANILVSLPESPDDRLDGALKEIRETVAGELLENIMVGTPEFFEFLVLDLLHAMGYGTSRGALTKVGGSGDGGIDGVISLDRLGLQKVCVQAKRWQNPVGRPEIQGFYGALAGRHVTQGVFITTSSFTVHAREFAASVGQIVLVDGGQLASYMIEHGIGVGHRVVNVPQLDSDYFER